MVNNEHEFVVSLAVAEEWGATGTAGLDNQYTTITPKALIGKGFGDLQTELLRPSRSPARSSILFRRCRTSTQMASYLNKPPPQWFMAPRFNTACNI